jgi:hypothetical protein
MTVIQTKLERSAYKHVALSLVPDLLIGWAVASYTDGGVMAFFLTLIALQGLYFAIWVKRSLWSWLLFWTVNRSTMCNHFEEAMAAQKFPPPPDYISGPDEYLSGIIDDKEEETTIRIRAAYEAGTLIGITTAGQYQFGFQMRLAFEDAIQRYAKRPSLRQS